MFSIVLGYWKFNALTWSLTIGGKCENEFLFKSHSEMSVVAVLPVSAAPHRTGFKSRTPHAVQLRTRFFVNFP